jgi:hypothetical protein
MTWEPDTYFNQPNGEIVLQQRITYKKSNGKLVKEIVTRHFYDDDYQDSWETEVITKL